MIEIPEWINGPEIERIVVYGPVGEYGEIEAFHVGHGGITKLERTYKSGEYSNIPYVRVYRDEKPIAEFCQHRLQGVYFLERPPAPRKDETIVKDKE